MLAALPSKQDHHHLPQRRETIAIVALLCVFLGLGIWYALDNPLYSKPDEAYHYLYTLYLKAGNGLPTVDMSRVGKDNHAPLEKEAHQPPAYYAAVAGLASLLGMQDRQPAPSINPHFLATAAGNRNPWVPPYVSPADAPIFFTGRFVSLWCGLIALLCIYLLARRFLPWPIALLSAAFTGLNAQFLFISTSFSNDMAGVALACAGLWLLGITIQEGLNARRGLLLGFVIALAGLTKLGGFGLLAPLAVIALWQAWKTRRLWPLVWAGLAAVVVAVVCSWWFWHNWRLYGDPLATNALMALMGPRVEPLTWDEFGSLLGFLWKAYWLDFSPGGILFAEPLVYWLIGLVCILAVVGSTLALVRDRSIRPLFLLTWGWFAVVCGSMLRMTTATAVFMGGGRLLFPAAAAVGVTMAVGLAELGFRRAIWPAALALLLGAYALGAPIRYLHPTYPRPLLAENLVRSPTHLSGARFGDDVCELLGYDTALVPDAAGQPTLEITYYWRALQGADRNFSVFVHLAGQDQPAPVAQLDTYPGYGSFPTTVWRNDRIFIDRLSLPLPENSGAIDGKLSTGLYDFQTMERLPAFSQQGERYPNDAVPLAQLTAGQLTEPAEMSTK